MWKNGVKWPRFVGYIHSANAFTVVFLVVFFSVVAAGGGQCGPEGYSSLLRSDGTFVPFSERGDILPDFSAVGYHSGVRDMRPGLADGLPSIGVAPGGENQDARRINQALEEAATFPLLEDGYRAVVRLDPGAYGLEGSIHVRHSGIILLGPEEGEPAVLTYLPKEQGTALRIGDRSMPQIVREQAVAMAADYVPVGSHRIPVEDASGFRVGDRVIVEYDCNAEWISVLGMDRIPPRFESRGGSRVDVIQQWRPEEYVYSALRVIEAIEGNELVLDAPTVMALNSRYGDTVVGIYTHDTVIENIGVAHLEIVSDYDPAVTTPNRWVVNPTEPVYADENHGAWAIAVNAARNGWIYQVTAKHFVQGCVTLNAASSHFTVSHCRNLDPVSRIDGGRRYSFNIGGQRHLVKHCYARGGRHDFVTPSRVPGPNVFYDCLAEESYNGSEPHHRMTKGVLFDNVRVWGPGACMAVLNRTNNGTGHGWMGAQIVFWNCASPLIIVQQPPIGQNVAIGVSEPHDRTTPEFINNMERRIRMTNQRSCKEFEFQGIAFVGDGHFESPDAPVVPRSLYQFQLQRRLR